MRIGLVTTSFPRFDGDCSGAFLLTIARELVRQGHAVRVLAPEPGHRLSAPEWPGIEVRWVSYARPRPLQRTFYRSGAPHNLRANPASWVGAVSFAATLDRAAKRELAECDALVSSWCLPSGWVAARTARGRPHLCICHATDVRWLARVPGGSAIARAVIEGATSMWFLSPSLRDGFFGVAGLARPTLTSHVGPMPIDPPQQLSIGRSALRRQLGIQGFTVLFMGRLVPVKGLELLLRALSELQDSVGIRIAGDGPERQRLRTLAARLGVDATFEGWVAGARKEALLQACDAIVVPSNPEDGLPTVLFEAEARALPIIATDVGAVAHHLRRLPDAILVPPRDRAALCKAIEHLRRVRV